MRFQQSCRMAVWLVIAPLLLGGCSILREFGPVVEVHTLDAGEAIELKRGDILTRGKLSDATTQTIRVAALDAQACAKPISADCVEALAAVTGVATDRRLAALSELWLAQAQAMKPGSEQQAAWFETIRYAYAYLFLGDHTPGERAFEDRQTQVRDWYNYAVERAATAIFEVEQQTPTQLPAQPHRNIAGWELQLDMRGERLPGSTAVPAELLPASSLSFRGMRSLYRRDGFGAELVAVMPDAPLTSAPTSEGSSSAKHDQQPLPWSEMSAPPMTVLLHPDGDDLDSVLHTRTARLTVHDPYEESAIMLHGQRVPLAANFTAGYGLWLARANFNRQSLRSLLGREGGIDRPHVYLMQPYDPNRRIIVMLHGLASSPEAWVELANEILGDETLRQHYQIWQVYYPTNLPIALNHAMIRRALGDTLAHFDPSGQAPASSDLVLVGHSMGGVIARLMVSSTDQSLVQLAADRSRLTPQQIKRIDPMLRFEPFPHVSRAIFIAAPHRGTSVAGGRLGRWMAGFIRFPVTVLEELAHTLAPNAAASSHESLGHIPNSVDNLDENDPFVRAAADFPISAQVRYHSILAQTNADVPLEDSDDGLVPYRSAHLPGAESEKVIISGHSVQQNAAAVLEIQRILKDDMALQEEHFMQP
ncbi:Alpha/beta hydrolase family protein [Marinobacterium sp. xm-a-121]|nr:Alpha/beta hydrolase family protein [Marinobacterium sp. xm-d-420]NRP38091.1 Alpha/beta hydrolase family protein [Marinobacterium sp. xm-a-121]NRP48143.1 Alpha/beta hydrolase family protein [Marinobacterium sp. xm-d-543]NRP57636.1 Alpha/beta hydrolase family protein [Marinobacterium sp. xm-d-510]NRP98148.1 Alpha/beta hydrolase family protein [Marinobacterium sp. xm-a-127]NRP98893.1 Alpha/beta hydrolase family protein [Marinobacterium sp. xm-v-233]NRQ24498.1 Alpha/beta hydrolase family prot